MSGPQFVNIQTWARKANKGNHSVESIIAEALREEGFISHLDDPQPPRPIIGDPHAFRQIHADHVAARSTSVTLADGTEKTRAIRMDRQTMASIVLSYPVPVAAIDTDDKRAAYQAWEDRNVDWLRDTYGDQLKVVMAHADETQPHIHAWILPDDPSADATTLHPGKTIKKQVEAQAKADGIVPREAVKLGNEAYKAVMAEWQDSYHAAVSLRLGLTRSGPLRRRVSRKQWKAEKATAKANAAALQKAEEAKVEVAEIEDKKRQIDAAARKLVIAQQKIDERKGSIADLEKAAEEKAERLISKAHAEVAKIIAGADAEAAKIIAGADAVAHEANMQAMKVAQEVHDHREGLKGVTAAIRSLVLKFGKVMGIGVDARDLGRDLLKIERALSAAEKSGPQADRPEI